MAKIISFNDISTALEHTVFVDAYRGKFVSLKDNSGIFLVKKIKVSTYDYAYNANEYNLMLQYQVECIKSGKQLEVSQRMVFSQYHINHFLETRQAEKVLEMIDDQMRSFVTIMTTGAAEVLYAEKKANLTKKA